jgi:hypothetical protein
MACSCCVVDLRLLIDFLHKVMSMGQWYPHAPMRPKLERKSAAIQSAQEILTTCQDGFQGKSQNPPMKGEGRTLEELLDKLRGLAGYPLAPTPKWIKTEKSQCSMPKPIVARPQDDGPQGDKPQDGRLQDGGPRPRSPQREKQGKELSDDTFVAAATAAVAATVHRPETSTIPEEETTFDDIYFDTSDAMNSAISASTSEPASLPS